MSFRFDHIIHFINDPEKGKEDLIKQGIHTVTGGAHENRGTHNTLSYFGIKYIELLGIHDRELFDQADAAEFPYSPFEEIVKNKFREGFAKICLSSPNLVKRKEQLEENGIKTYGPFPLSRKRPDGKLLEWELLLAGGHEGELPLPFFIDWGEADDVRVAQLTEDGTIAEHEAGDLQLADVSFIVKDAKATAALWEKLFELKAKASYTDESLAGIAYPLQFGDVTLTFIQPDGKDGEAAQLLEEKGEHPYLVTLTGANEEREFTTYGANYRLKK